MTHHTEKRTIEARQTEAQRLAEMVERYAASNTVTSQAAALLRRQDELLARALEALDYIVGASAPMTSQQEQCWPSMQAALTAIRAHREAK